MLYFFFLWRFDPIQCHGLVLRGSAIILTGHNTIGMTPLDDWSARRRDLYLTLHKTQKKHVHTSIGIRTRNPSKRAAADQRFNWGQRNRSLMVCSLLVHKSACHTDRKHRMRVFLNKWRGKPSWPGRNETAVTEQNYVIRSFIICTG